MKSVASAFQSAPVPKDKRYVSEETIRASEQLVSIRSRP